VDSNNDSALRGSEPVQETKAPYGITTNAISEEKSDGKPSIKTNMDTGTRTIMNLGQRICKINATWGTPTKGRAQLANYIKDSFVFRTVLQAFTFWRADISIKVVPRFSPLSVGRVRFGYFPRDVEPTGLDDNQFAFHLTNTRFVDVDISSGEGAMIDCRQASNREWFVSGLTTGGNPSTYPGRFVWETLFLDDILDGTFDFYLIFNNIEVAYPRGVFVPQAPLAFMQSKDTVADRQENNSFRQGRQKIANRPTTTLMPKQSENDMNFNHISKHFPYYVSLGAFSAAGGKGFAIRDLFYAQPTTAATSFAIHPLTDVIHNCRTSFDVHVKLHCVMNSFQTGVLSINYGNYIGEAAGQQLVASTTGNMMTINWNLSEQNTIEFDLPFVYEYKFYSSESAEFRFFTVNNTPIIPLTSGVGDTVFVYALITLTNFKCYDRPRGNILTSPGKAPTTLIRDVAYMQSDDGDGFSDVMMASSRIFTVVTTPSTTEANTFWPAFYATFMNSAGYLVLTPITQGVSVDLTESTYEVYPEVSFFDSNLTTLYSNYQDGDYDFSNVVFSYCNGHRSVTIT
jgi:hypothetical protein